MAAVQTIELGVREFLDLTVKAGGPADFSTPARAQAGTAAHVGATARRPAGYQREVPVRHEFRWDAFRLVLRGRIDGVLVDGDTVRVEEIKSTFLPLDGLDPAAHPYHLAQLHLYHYFASLRYPSTVVPVLTYVHPITLDERAFPMDWSVAASRIEFERLAMRLLLAEADKRRWSSVRNAALRTLPFPYPDLRPGQAALLDAVADAVRAPRDLLVEAATGIGKTMAVLYPALKGLAGRHGYRRVFYLTAKSAGVETARQAVAALRAEGLRLRAVYLRAKSHMCPRAEEDPECDAALCPYADDFFTRAEPLIPDLLAEEELSAARVEAVGRAATLCPFELALELALFADLIVCDYNYAFDPRVTLRRFFAPGVPPEHLLLVDEAHNLLPRSRAMYSADLAENLLEEIAALCEAHEGVAEATAWLRGQFRRWEALRDDEGSALLRLDNLPQETRDGVDAVLECAGEVLMHLPHGTRRRQLLERYYTLDAFASIAEALTPEYAIYLDTERRSRTLRLLCRYPAPQLRKALSRSRTAVFFSGTLTPFDYYRDLYGAREGAATLALPSPFPREHRLYLHVPDVSTKYTERDRTRPTVAAVLRTAVRAHAGNYLAFFPSYAYLSAVWAELMVGRPDDMAIHVQKPNLAPAAQAEFLARVCATGGKPNLGLAVMGGLFGEAVDLPGEQLVGAVIVGPGLPGVSTELELIAEYFNEERHGAGFHYAYLVPGITRVVQAAGRVFRTPEDKGVVLLIDDRFLEEPYRDLLPSDWHAHDPEFSTTDYAAVLEAFWRE
jgi:DNA excision repair protein ERCC-2